MQVSKHRAGIYLAGQGIGVLVWWCALLAVPEMRELFFAPGASSVALSKFLVPDVLIFGGSSTFAGWSILRRSKHAVPASFFALGSVAYALIGTIAVNWPIGTRPFADLLMLLSLLGSAWAVREAAG